MHPVFLLYSHLCTGRVAQSVQRLTTGWTVRGSMPSFGRGRKIICPMLVTRTNKKRSKSSKTVKTGKTINYGTKKNPGGIEIFRTRPDRPWCPPSLLYNGYRVFLGGRKRPGRDADHPLPSSAEVENE
jgi:hypothetical protein